MMNISINRIQNLQKNDPLKYDSFLKQQFEFLYFLVSFINNNVIINNT